MVKEKKIWTFPSENLTLVLEETIDILLCCFRAALRVSCVLSELREQLTPHCCYLGDGRVTWSSSVLRGSN